MIHDLGNSRRARSLARRFSVSSLAISALLIASCDDGAVSPLKDSGTTPVTAGDGGTVSITTDRVNHCPMVSVAVSPPTAHVGDSLALSVVASDADPTDKLTYSWTAGAGAFADANAAKTVYTCGSVGGSQVLSLTVSDGACSVVRKVEVYCYATDGGAADVAPPSDGNSSSGGSGGQGEGGSGGRVGGSGGSGAGTGGGAGGRTGTGGVAGQTGGAPGTGGAGTGGASAMCSEDPISDEGDACNTCTVDNCVPETDGCDHLDSDAKIQACRNLYCCIRANHCAVAGDPIRCWCGTAQYSDCVSVAATDARGANGPCLREFEAASPTKKPADIKQYLVDPNYGLGSAVNLSQCRGNFCEAECKL